MQDTVILFDIDYTLFDTHTMRSLVYPKLATVLRVQYDDSFQTTIKLLEQKVKDEKGYFDPRYFLLLLSESYNPTIDLDIVEKTFFDEELFEQSLLPQTVSVLEHLSKKEHVSLGVFSTGDPLFQAFKIQRVLSLFDKNAIHISLNKNETIESVFTNYTDKKVYIVDDRKDILELIKHYNSSITTVLISQDPVETDFKIDYKIITLKELESII